MIAGGVFLEAPSWVVRQLRFDTCSLITCINDINGDDISIYYDIFVHIGALMHYSDSMTGNSLCDDDYAQIPYHNGFIKN